MTDLLRLPRERLDAVPETQLQRHRDVAVTLDEEVARLPGAGLP